MATKTKLWNKRKITTIIKDGGIDELVKRKCAYIGGSVARGLNFVHDLDVIVLKECEPELWENLQKYDPNLKIKTGEKRDKAYTIILSNGLQIDIRITNKNTLPFMLSYFIGSKPFNIALRILALNKGYQLTDTKMVPSKPGVAPVKIGKEEDIFRVLGYKGVPYRKRSVTNIEQGISVIREGKIDQDL